MRYVHQIAFLSEQLVLHFLSWKTKVPISKKKSLTWLMILYVRTYVRLQQAYFLNHIMFHAFQSKNA